MTTFHAAETALLADVRGRIIDLTPDHEPSKRFWKRMNTRRGGGKTIEEMGAHRPRLFEIGPGEPFGEFYVGGNVLGSIVHYPITIVYPDNGEDGWMRGALSDAAKIRHDLITNPSTASGVQGRYLDPQQQPMPEQSEADPIIWLRLTLKVFYEYTG